ncbi:MAG TPA: purine-nucleoside phosphorylase [Thermoanaerobaculia bacterium]|nr:purine-nucleoside phosphorylase [Thermoanaerobaculia bacterium]
MDAKLKETASWISERLPAPPAVGLILGSGLGDFADGVTEAVAIPYHDIPGFPSSAVVGHAGKLVAGRVRGVPVVVLAGRVHYYEGHPMSAVAFPARVLGLLGCRDVIVTNAAGGIDRRLSAGDLMLIEDHINAMGSNPLVGPNDDDLGPRFPDMSEAYKKDLRALALRVAKRERIPLKRGVYVATHGPSYETPAEIRMYRTWGATAVGMSTVPEVIALNQMGVAVAGISCITNMAAGVLPQKLDHTEVLETTQRVKDRFVTLLTGLVEMIGSGRTGEAPPAPAPRRAPAANARTKARKRARKPARKSRR